jgi:negative regulator of flagellin synthesis FlgM
MKIDPTMKAPTLGAVPDERPRTTKHDAPSRQPGAATVQVSSLASQLQSIDTGAEAGKSVDTSRVAKVKAAIAEGRYKIDPEKIADRLIESAREALRGPKS